MSIISERGLLFLPYKLKKTDRKYLFIFKMSSLGHLNGFYLKLWGGETALFEGQSLFVWVLKRNNLTKRSRLIITSYRNRLQCALIMNVSSDAVYFGLFLFLFHFIFLFFFCCLVCFILFFSLCFSLILVLL